LKLDTKVGSQTKDNRPDEKQVYSIVISTIAAFSNSEIPKRTSMDEDENHLYTTPMETPM
jgi:hypothetical protein